MKISSIQALRAIAAMLVVAFHANVFLLPQHFFEGEKSWSGFDMGYAGVEIFFVLSGFIMVYAHRRDFGVPSRAGHFLQRRIFRIYPFYWVVLAGLIALYASAPGRGPENVLDPATIATSALLLPTAEQPILGVSWTLQHEMLFYFVFVGILLNRGLGIAIFATWMLGCFANIMFPVSGTYPQFLLSSYNCLFVFGIVAALARDAMSETMARRLALVGAGVFMAVGLSEVYGVWDWDKDMRTLAYGAGGAAVVAGLSRANLTVPRFLEFLGDASYSIYLVHMPAMTVLAAIVGSLHHVEMLTPTIVMVILLAYSAIVGSLAHVLIERPMLRWLMAPSRRRKKTARPIPE